MKKICSLLLAGVLTLSVLVGCGQSAQPDNSKIQATESAEETSGAAELSSKSPQATQEGTDTADAETGYRTVVDNNGIAVQIPDKIERVAIVWLLPLPSVMAVYQGGDVSNLVAMPPDSLNAAENSILSRYSPEILNVSTAFYEGGELNMEELMNLNPDVVFYSGPVTRAEPFEAAGIPAVAFSTTSDDNPSTLDALERWFTLLDDVLQYEGSNYKEIIAYGREIEVEIASRVSDLPEAERKKMMIISHYNDSVLSVGGKNSFTEYYCKAVNSIDVAAGSPDGNSNMEQIYEWAPEIIFLSTLTSYMPKDLYENTAAAGHDWSSVPAVQNKQVFKFPLGMHRWWPPSTDVPLSLLWIAKTTYPERFEDINMEEKTREYYQKYYNMELSDQDLEWIFNPFENLGRKFY